MNGTCKMMIGSLGLGLVTIGCDPGSGSEPEMVGDQTTTTDGTGSTAASGNVASLPFSDGWIAESENTFGIQGSFYPFSDATDGRASSIAPESFASGSESICASGTAGQVVGDALDVYWGPRLG
jgi:hypothetical protein